MPWGVNRGFANKRGVNVLFDFVVLYTMQVSNRLIFSDMANILSVLIIIIKFITTFNFLMDLTRLYLQSYWFIPDTYNYIMIGLKNRI